MMLRVHSLRTCLLNCTGPACAPIDSGETQDARMERVCMLRALIKYLHVGLNEREEGLIPLQQAVLLEDPIHPAQALRSGHEGGESAHTVRILLPELSCRSLDM